jgi:hypothetical protein
MPFTLLAMKRRERRQLDAAVNLTITGLNPESRDL